MRVSLSIASNLEDAYALIISIQSLQDEAETQRHIQEYWEKFAPAGKLFMHPIHASLISWSAVWALCGSSEYLSEPRAFNFAAVALGEAHGLRCSTHSVLSMGIKLMGCSDKHSVTIRIRRIILYTYYTSIIRVFWNWPGIGPKIR